MVQDSLRYPDEGDTMVASLASSFRSPATGFLSLSDQFTTEYYEQGEGEPLVVIPGLAGGTGLIQPLIDSLSDRFRVISFELRGETNGFFDRRYHFDRLVRDVGDVLDGLRLERPGLLGLSFGGAIALDYASRNSNRLSFLAVQGAGPSHHAGAFAGVARRVLERLLLPDNSPFVNQFFRLLTADRSDDGTTMDFVAGHCWRTDQSIMAHRFSLLDEYDITDRLGRLRLPVLSITGENDVLATPSSLEALHTAAPNVEAHILPGAGHFAFVTHAEKIAGLVSDFSRGVLAVA